MGLNKGENIILKINHQLYKSLLILKLKELQMIIIIFTLFNFQNVDHQELS